ncbi:hypothetical protein CYLTODRAFT_423263, partial [Cylindrobasidium torrendii FP15055 ss-10]
MAKTNVYLSASASADAWALYFGQDDVRNVSQKSMNRSKTEGLTELKGLCHLYRRWLEDSTAPEGVVSVHTRSISLIAWIRVYMPVAQEHGWKAAAKQLPANVEPVLRYLSALFDNAKISCPKTTVEFVVVPEGVDHSWLRRAERLADSADDPEEEMDWCRLTLHVRRKLRDTIQLAQIWASQKELEKAQRLLEDAKEEDTRDRQIQSLWLSYVALWRPKAKASEVSKERADRHKRIRAIQTDAPDYRCPILGKRARSSENVAIKKRARH